VPEVCCIHALATSMLEGACVRQLFIIGC
jgi:hypothetical protein